MLIYWDVVYIKSRCARQRCKRMLTRGIRTTHERHHLSCYGSTNHTLSLRNDITGVLVPFHWYWYQANDFLTESDAVTKPHNATNCLSLLHRQDCKIYRDTSTYFTRAVVYSVFIKTLCTILFMSTFYISISQMYRTLSLLVTETWFLHFVGTTNNKWRYCLIYTSVREADNRPQNNIFLISINDYVVNHPTVADKAALQIIFERFCAFLGCCLCAFPSSCRFEFVFAVYPSNNHTVYKSLCTVIYFYQIKVYKTWLPFM